MDHAAVQPGGGAGGVQQRSGGGFECEAFDWRSVRHPDYAGVDAGEAEWEEGYFLPRGADL